MSGGISRRRFLQVGAVGVVAMAGVGIWGWTRSGERQLDGIFGDHLDGVIAVGRRAVETGVVVDVEGAAAMLPETGITVGEKTADGRVVEITNDRAFGRAVNAAVRRELEAGEMVRLDAYLFAPSELAVAALAYLEYGATAS